MKSSIHIVLIMSFFIGLNCPSIASRETEEEIQNEPYIKITAHNVGQGLCQTIELYDPKDQIYKDGPLYLLNDGGSTTYGKELLYYEYFMEKAAKLEENKSEEGSPLSFQADVLYEEEEKKSEKAELLFTPHQVHKEPMIPPSAINPSSDKAHRYVSKHHKIITQTEKKRIKVRQIQKIQQSLGIIGEDLTSIKVEAVIVSHPDVDHYKWISKILSFECNVKNVICGGLPEGYNPIFRKWLEVNIGKGTEVFFPAVQDTKILSLKEILLESHQGQVKKLERQYMPQSYSDFQTGASLFKNVLPFGPSIKAFFLSINPTHEQGKMKVLRHCSPEDDNTDSLVIKLQVGGLSAILTGDATSMTTNRIIDNYSDNPTFLETDLLFPSHHGADSHGSNDEMWIRATKCKYAIFSCGSSQGHPTHIAYDNIKNFGSLKQVNPHNIWVWNGKRKAVNHFTHRAIFSTFASGTISINLSFSKGLEIETERGEIFSNVPFTDIAEEKGDKEISLLFSKEELKKLDETLVQEAGPSSSFISSNLELLKGDFGSGSEQVSYFSDELSLTPVGAPSSPYKSYDKVASDDKAASESQPLSSSMSKAPEERSDSKQASQEEGQSQQFEVKKDRDPAEKERKGKQVKRKRKNK